MNILNLYHYKSLQGTNSTNKLSPDPLFSQCPYNSQQILSLPRLKLTNEFT